MWRSFAAGSPGCARPGCAPATLLERASSARTFSSFAFGRGQLPRCRCAHRGRAARAHLPHIMSAAAAEQAFADLQVDRPGSCWDRSAEPPDRVTPRRRSRSAHPRVALRLRRCAFPSSVGLTWRCRSGRRLLRVIGKGDRERRVPYGGSGREGVRSLVAQRAPRAGRPAERGGAAGRRPGRPARSAYGS